VADVGFHPAHVQRDLPGPDDPVEAAKLVADPGEQLVEGERLGQVVPRAEVEAIYLVPDVGQAGQDQDGLAGAVVQQLPQPGGVPMPWSRACGYVFENFRRACRILVAPFEA
jgi:hypothetical protein